MIQNQQEKVILSVYRNKSFTKAASELGISQPALSAAVNKIEKKLGIRIFERKQTPIQPTEEGMVLIEYLKKTKLEYEACFHKINDIVKNKNRKLTIGAPAVYANTYLLDKIVKFNQEYSECKLSVHIATLPELMDMCDEGMIDCFISTSDELKSDFDIEKVLTEKIYLCVPRDWKINEKMKQYQVREGKTLEGSAIDWKIFSDLEMISLKENQPLQQQINKFLEKENVSINSRIVVDQVMFGIELAAKGLGMMFCSEGAIMNCRDKEQLCLYPLPNYLAERNIYVAYNNNYYLSDMCRGFIDILKND